MSDYTSITIDGGLVRKAAEWVEPPELSPEAFDFVRHNTTDEALIDFRNRLRRGERPTMKDKTAVFSKHVGQEQTPKGLRKLADDLERKQKAARKAAKRRRKQEKQRAADREFVLDQLRKRVRRGDVEAMRMLLEESR